MLHAGTGTSLRTFVSAITTRRWLVISRRLLPTLLALCACLGSVKPANAEVRHVDSGAPPGGDGLSWATAYDSPSTALATAQSGDQIWVAAGTYVGNFTLALGVEVYGGFVGNETELSQRDWKANPTILDGNGTGSVVTSPSGATATTRIDGFTITNGRAPDGHAGGGFHLYSSSPTIANNTITGNSARSAGGMSLAFSYPMIRNNTITGNNAPYGGGGLYLYASSPTIVNNMITSNSSYSSGGGLYLRYSSPTIANNTITGNSATGSGGGLFLSASSPIVADNSITGNSAPYGGGLSLHWSSPTIASNTITGNSAAYEGGGLSLQDSSPTIANNTITDNEARNYGGGMYLWESSPTIVHNTVAGNSVDRHGGGLYLRYSSPTIANNMIVRNSATYGGGLYLELSSPTIANNTITCNLAYSKGGGLYLYWDSSPTIANNTITGNGADHAGGGLCLYRDSSPTLANTIVAFNSSGIHRYDTAITPTLQYNCVYGNTAYDYSGVIDPTGTDGNIAADPLFELDPDPGPDGLWGTPDDNLGNLRLSSGSPCIDAGDNDRVPPDMPDLDGDSDTEEPLPLDLAGGPRFLDDPQTPDTGNPGITGFPIVDMGAYEFVSSCGNGVVDPAEECDDAGESEVCDLDCTIAECGDDTLNVTAYEACDDGNTSDCDGCRGNCSAVEGTCGDGILDLVCEECDDGNTAHGDGCDENCILEVCGNGILQFNEECDDGPENSDTEPDACRTTCVLPSCGDGVVDTGEECDDGNTANGDGCDEDCILEVCGNGVLQFGEQCDNGPDNSDIDPDACRTACVLPLCRDGVVDTGEECDDGSESAMCDADCTFAVCGDGTVNMTAGEECDDGKIQVGDGCDATCHIEPEVIPTVSEWGLIIMGLVLLAGLKIKFGRRPSTHA
ncbi:MAG: right-handed parallel beta-helix repeat-containing protein [Phycisphaerales bacterium]|nr:MAG: right-handed parallel beta-helix repeat-containing protein [Phycisphaerales bacterium]